MLFLIWKIIDIVFYVVFLLLLIKLFVEIFSKKKFINIIYFIAIISTYVLLALTFDTGNTIKIDDKPIVISKPIPLSIEKEICIKHGILYNYQLYLTFVPKSDGSKYYCSKAIPFSTGIETGIILKIDSVHVDSIKENEINYKVFYTWKWKLLVFPIFHQNRVFQGKF